MLRTKLTLSNGFLPTPSARRATYSLWDEAAAVSISTHALREEGDQGPAGNGMAHLRISTHALREEGDNLTDDNGEKVFDFYPRPPRGGRPDHDRIQDDLQEISTHALREEGDSSESR